MRLPLAISLALGTMVFVNHPVSHSTVVWALLGAVIGVFYWWGQLAFLAVLFAKRVPEAITLKSINKIRPFAAVLFFVMAVLALLLALR